eukprot:jgi/Tetstr1/462467/TSEL_007463.t1
MRLLDLLERFDIGIIARHIPGRENTLVDCLSRLGGAIHYHSCLLVAIFRELEAACGPFDVVAYFRRGHALFTSTEWQDANRTNPVRTHHVYQRPTIWAVVLIHVSPAGPMDSYSAKSTSELPRLSSDGPRDLVCMRKLPDGFVRPVHGTSGHRGA